MRRTSREAVSTTRSLVSRMFRILAITTLLCLAFGVSFSVPASAHQARPTIAASCTATQTWVIDIPPGGVTLWLGNDLFTNSTEVTITVTLDASNNVCSISLNASFTLTDSSGKTITVTAVTSCSPAGTFNPTTGALTLNGAWTLNNVPFFQGPQTTACGTLSTENTINPPDGSHHSGHRVDSSGNVTLVGTTSFGSGFFTMNIWIQIVGTFKRVS